MTVNTKLLDGIVIFVQVIDFGSFTKTADATGHSTSYISKEINKLEARLNVRLLNRTTRSIGLTPEGQVYYTQCKQIVEEALSAQSFINNQEGQPRGRLKISCPVSFGLTRLRPLLAQYLNEFPLVDLDVDLNDRKVDIITDGFDVVIRGTTNLEDSSLISRTLVSSYSITLASPAYLKKNGTPKTPQDLIEHQCISYSLSKNPNLWTFPLEDGSSEDIKIKAKVMTSSPELELEMAVAGHGITRMPAFNLNGQLENGQLVEVFPNIPKYDINLYLVYASRKHMSPKVRSFIDFTLKAFETERN